MKYRAAIAIPIISLLSQNAFAYSFDVKVINKMSHNVEVNGVSYQPKGPGLPPMCGYIPAESRDLRKNEFVNPSCPANVQKWQRKVSVTFKCPQNSNNRTLTFPRNGGFYKRDHAVNNGHRYTIKLRDKDC
jgi:hypothetical protein